MKKGLLMAALALATPSLAQIKVNHHQYSEPVGPDRIMNKCGVTDEDHETPPISVLPDLVAFSLASLGLGLTVKVVKRRRYNRPV